MAKNTLSYATLRANSDAVVTDILAETGQVISAGIPVIRLAKNGEREAVVALPETMRPPIGSTAQVQLYGNENSPVSAVLRQLSSSANPTTRTFEARYTLSGELANAPIGSTVNVIILQNQQALNDTLQVPLAAILDKGNGVGVYVVSQNKVMWRAIEI